jgi:hypothetical protein
MDDTWIEWNGGRIPVYPLARVDLKHRGGGESTDVEAYPLDWEHEGTDIDIVGYRVRDEK